MAEAKGRVLSPRSFVDSPAVPSLEIVQNFFFLCLIWRSAVRLRENISVDWNEVNWLLAEPILEGRVQDQVWPQ
jgi:hypothetical protein